MERSRVLSDARAEAERIPIPGDSVIEESRIEPLSRFGSRRRTLLVLGGMLLGLLLAALDQTIVATAMPRVVGSLGGLDLFAWVFSAYMLASTTITPIAGKLSDVYGRRWIFLTGILVFMIGSALSGASQSMIQLIASRGIQGLGAGVLFPVTMATIGDIYPPAQRGRIQGVFAGVFGLASIIGPTAGGYLVDNASWRWIFYINLPVGFLAFTVLYVTLKETADRTVRRTVDYLGGGLLTAAIVTSLLIVIWGGREYSWTSAQIFGLAAASVALWISVFLVERRVDDPMLPIGFFKNRVFTISMISTFLTSMGMFGAILFIPLFIQFVIGTSATRSGLLLTPMMLGMVVTSVIAGQIMSRWRRYKFLAFVGIGGMAAGFYLLSTMGPGTSNAEAIRNMVIVGAGLGVTFPLYMIAVQNAFSRDQLGSVTASLQFFRGMGGTIGATIFGAVMTARFKGELSRLVGELPEAARSQIPTERLAAIAANPQALAAGSGIEATLPQQILDLMRDALSSSITLLFFIGLVVLVVAFVINIWLPDARLRDTWEVGENMPGGQAES